MSKNNSKSLTSLRQKLRKYNKEFEPDLAKFREAPDAADDDEAEEKGNILLINCSTMSCYFLEIPRL